jgi:hypothetical protein
MSALAHFVVATAHLPVCEGDDDAGFDLQECEIEDASKAWKDKPIYCEHDSSLPPIGYVQKMFQQKDGSMDAKMMIVYTPLSAPSPIEFATNQVTNVCLNNRGTSLEEDRYESPPLLIASVTIEKEEEK